MNQLDRLTVVSNRLPVVISRKDDDGWDVQPGSGGLVQAMSPILERSGGTWIGWPGLTAEETNGAEFPLDDVVADVGYDLQPVTLTNDQVEGYYAGFANSIVWPLFHGFPDRCQFNPDFWNTYLDVNDRFAAVVAAQTEPGDTIWVHDYHLIHAADFLYERTSPDRIGFFLHIPFPHLQNYVMLPWRADLLRAFLSYDLIGFQSGRDRHNFLDCVERLMPEVRVVRDDPISRVEVDGREVWVGAFPIGMDFDAFDETARSPGVARRMDELRTDFNGFNVILGVDRLDYTKGLLHRLRAFETALEQHEELRENVILFQLVVPSRETVPEYAALKEEVDRLIGRINGKFGTTGWEPVHYMYNTVDKKTLVALYRLASTALVTPLRDGMNLVSKEYCASHPDDDGVLILSEMAGAAAQLRDGALLVNPNDREGMADAIHQAVSMEPEEARRRMRLMRKTISDTDVFWWANEFLTALREPRSSSEAEDYEYLPVFDTPAKH